MTEKKIKFEGPIQEYRPMLTYVLTGEHHGYKEATVRIELPTTYQNGPDDPQIYNNVRTTLTLAEARKLKGQLNETIEFLLKLEKSEQKK